MYNGVLQSNRGVARIASIFLIAMTAFNVSNLFAQPYPSKAVRFIVPFVVGGSIDSIARSFALPLSTSFGQQIIIDNRPGNEGVIAAQAASQAAPDGHTVVILNQRIAETAAAQAAPFEITKSLVPVSHIGTGQFMKQPGWLGIFAPAGTPPTVIASIDSAVQRAMQTQGVEAALARVKIAAQYAPSAQFARVIAGVAPNLDTSASNPAPVLSAETEERVRKLQAVYTASCSAGELNAHPDRRDMCGRARDTLQKAGRLP